MTGPELPDYDRLLAERQAELLRRIQDLAGEHARITGLGYHGYDGTDSDAQAAWSAHLGALDAQREAAEAAALAVGVPEPWIEDIRELGSRIGGSPRPLQPPAPLPNEASSFLVDMLLVELVQLQRMAMIAAAVEDRIATGRSMIPLDPAGSAYLRQNMELKYQRATALANAAGLSAAEGRHLWDLDAPTWQRMHASTIATYTEAELLAQWRQCAHPSPEMALPPYVGVGTDGIPPTRAELLPPTPEDMISHAAAAIRRDFIDAAIDIDTAIDPQGRISAAIEAALPTEVEPNDSLEPRTAGLPGRSPDTHLESDPPPHRDAGPDP